MKGVKTGSFCVVALLLLVNLISFNALSAEEEDTRFPYLATVTRGTAAGTVANIAGIDGVYYAVAEQDTNTGRSYTNTTLDPNAVGTNTGWTGEVGPGADHYEAVDEGPPHDDNVSYVFQTVAGGGAGIAIDTYNAENYALAPGYTIDEMRVSGYALETITSGTTYNNCVLSGVTLSCGSGNTLTLVYTNYTTPYATDPDTGIAWIDSGIDSVELGHKAVWNPPNVATSMRSTVVFATVQSSIGLLDYTLDFRLDFEGIEYSGEPKLIITGYRGGDAETITLQILRGGVWTTLSANAFGAASATSEYDLSKLDVAGGSASVRIVDNDATDDTQSTVYLDEMKIITTGEASDPAAPVDVYVHLSYDLWGNKIIVEVTWTQMGGREDGVETGKWAILTADGVEMGSYQVNSKLTVDAPWPWFDGNDHIVNATGVVNVVFPDWGHNQTYYSDPDTMHISNFPRWAITLILVFIVCAIIAIFAVSALKRAKEYREYEERKD